jgi:hypothetical protein
LQLAENVHDTFIYVAIGTPRMPRYPRYNHPTLYFCDIDADLAPRDRVLNILARHRVKAVTFQDKFKGQNRCWFRHRSFLSKTCLCTENPLLRYIVSRSSDQFSMQAILH